MWLLGVGVNLIQLSVMFASLAPALPSSSSEVTMGVKPDWELSILLGTS